MNSVFLVHDTGTCLSKCSVWVVTGRATGSPHLGCRTHRVGGGEHKVILVEWTYLSPVSLFLGSPPGVPGGLLRATDLHVLLGCLTVCSRPARLSGVSVMPVVWVQLARAW